MSYIANVIKKGFEFTKSGKIGDCIYHAFDLINLYVNYGKSKEPIIQKRLLLRTLKNAYENCEYYKLIANNIKDKNDINEYPFLDKELVIENFDRLVSNNKNKMIYNIATTGGSTGKPLEFLNANGTDDYFQFQLWKKYGYEDGDKILSLMGMKIKDEDLRNNIFWVDTPIFSTSNGGYNLSSLYLTDDNINIYCEYILRLKPSFIRSFPSFAYEIAKYIIDNKVKIDFNIKAVELTSENSYPWQREIISKAFNTKVFLQYGHTESCVFAYSFDDTMRLKVEPLYGYVEIIKDNGDHAKVGEIGEVVCTTLHNKVMPFIRYKTGDLAVFGGYEDNHMIINELIGRCQNYFINKDNKKMILTPFIADHHLKSLGKVIKYQFEQFEPGKMIIHIVKTESFTKKDEEEIKSLFENPGKIECEFDYVDEIKKSNRGKSVLMVQHIKDLAD